MATHESVAYDQGLDDSREMLADWMTSHGFATGHGDTLSELLSELSWQVQELRNRLKFITEQAS